MFIIATQDTLIILESAKFAQDVKNAPELQQHALSVIHLN